VSKQLLLMILGAVATAMVAVVAVIQLTGGDSGSLEPPPEIVTEAPAEQAARAARADRVARSVPAEQASQADHGPGRASRQEFADWVLICPPDSSARHCLIGQNHIQAETQRTIFAIQLRRPDDGAVEALLITPLHVRLQAGVALDIGKAEPLKIEFSQCRGEQCQADARLNDDVITRLLTAQSARATFEVATGQSATIDISLNGFAEAWAGLNQKVTN
jgi:invasion protein IalB